MMFALFTMALVFDRDVLTPPPLTTFPALVLYHPFGLG